MHTLFILTNQYMNVKLIRVIELINVAMYKNNTIVNLKVVNYFRSVYKLM